VENELYPSFTSTIYIVVVFGLTQGFCCNDVQTGLPAGMLVHLYEYTPDPPVAVDNSCNCDPSLHICKELADATILRALPLRLTVTWSFAVHPFASVTPSVKVVAEYKYAVCGDKVVGPVAMFTAGVQE
jgi:hypothetical protein